MLEIKTFSGEWREVTKNQAEKYYKSFCKRAGVLDAKKYFNDNYIRGGHVFYNGAVETTEEQDERMFQAYKEMLSKDRYTRFNVIEYLCRFPEIDPFEMAASLLKDGITVLFNDSSISKSENKAKERKVNKLL